MDDENQNNKSIVDSNDSGITDDNQGVDEHDSSLQGIFYDLNDIRK